MDLKKEAARVAYTLIRNNSAVGLGDGSTMIWLAKYLINGISGGLQINLYTSSFKTEQFLKDAGITVHDISQIDTLDQYFDGCDQVDQQLNALKSGAGIHSSEKLLASMAKKFIILGDESKFVSILNSRYPLVLEVLPPSTHYVLKEMKKIFGEISLTIRTEGNLNSPVITRYGNHLIDCRFSILPELEFIQKESKNITGVVEISLFYQLANGAIIAGEHGINRYERKNGLVILMND